MRKRITYKNIFGAGLAILAFSFASVVNTNAQGVDAPSCESLGYDLTEADCAGRLFLKCPFDQTKYFCPDEPASDSCKVGDILYSDKTCSSDVVSGKTPIAVVFNTDKRLAIALKTEQELWMPSLEDIPGLTNHTTEETAKMDWEGKKNTRIAINYCKNVIQGCPAFEYANTYKTEGTNAGDWYLPALGELNNIYENRTILNSTLSLIRGRALPTYDCSHLSSTEYDDTSLWRLSFSNDSIKSYPGKSASGCVRPVLAF